MSENLEKLPELTPEDELKTAEVLKNVEGIFFADEAMKRAKEEFEEEAAAEEVLREGRNILGETLDAEIEYISGKFSEFWEDPKKTADTFSFLEKTYGWSRSETQAMLGVLRHGFNDLYDFKFYPPDERNLKAEGGRDLKTMVLDFIAHDYNQDIADKVSPLLNFYIIKAKEFLKSRAGGNETGDLDKQEQEK